jgi:hypothetical protein
MTASTNYGTAAPDDDIGIKWETDFDVEVEATEHEVLEEGSYPVQFLTFERAQTQFGPSLKLHYEVTEGPHQGAQLDEIASAKGGDGSKLKDRMGVLRGEPYQRGEQIKPAELFGRKALALVAIKEVSRNGQSFQVNRVVKLSPLRKGPAKRSAGRPAQLTDQQSPQ